MKVYAMYFTMALNKNNLNLICIFWWDVVPSLPITSICFSMWNTYSKTVKNSTSLTVQDHKEYKTVAGSYKKNPIRKETQMSSSFFTQYKFFPILRYISVPDIFNEFRNHIHLIFQEEND
jgi:hypothetical protein